MKGHPIPYSEEDLAWISARRDWPRRRLHVEFCAEFSRRDISFDAFRGMCKRKRFMTGRSGHFPKNGAAWNKGRAIPAHPNSQKTQFKPGVRRGRAEQVYKPIGAERIREDGYLERKVHDGLPLHTQWEFVHRLRWEAANGPVPKGCCLKSLDGDKTNTDPSNWIAIPRALLPRLNGRWNGLSYDDAPDELKPLILAAARVDNAAREIKRDARNARAHPPA